MIIFKRLILLLFVLPILFVLFSFLQNQKVHAATNNLAVQVRIDSNSNKDFEASKDECYSSNKVALRLNTTNLPEYMNGSNCTKIFDAPTTAFNLELTKPTASLSYIRVGDSKGTKTYSDLRGRSLISVNPGQITATVIFGLKNPAPTTKPSTSPKLTKKPTPPPNPTCDKNAPKLEITPDNRNGSPGDEKQYSVKITNKDAGAGCKAVTFVLSKVKMPNDKWDGKFGDNTLSIKKKESKSTIFKVKSPARATPGVKEITIGLKRQTQENVQVKGHLKYTVQGANPSPTKEPTPTPTRKPTACNKLTPEVTITQDKAFVKPGGGKITYTVKVKNIDEGPCPERSMNLTRNLHNDNWKGVWDPNNNFKFNKGETRSKKLAVTSPEGAPKGTYKVKVNLRNNDDKVVLTKEAGFIISNTEPSPSPSPTPTVCVKKAPGFSVTPDSITAKPGKAVAYTIVIKNNDTGPCAKRSLSLKAKLPASAWRAIFAKESFDLEKGGQATLNVGITSPTNAPDGTNTIAIDLNNASGQIVKTQNVSYIVSASQTGETILKITLEADGLGTTKRIPLGGNKNPDPDFTNLDVFLYSASSNTRSFETNTTFTYDPDPKKEKLVGTVSLPSGFPNGVYNLYAIGPQYKLTQLPGSITLTGEDKTIENENFHLIAGDVNKTGSSYNNIDSLDYHVLLSCSIYSQDPETCDKDPNYKEYSDLNYDGIVNEDDFTLWLKEVRNQEGAQFPDQ